MGRSACVNGDAGRVGVGQGGGYLLVSPGPEVCGAAALGKGVIG